ncbi:hypothetical protein D3C76_1494270 [compost metagenome]
MQVMVGIMVITIIRPWPTGCRVRLEQAPMMRVNGELLLYLVLMLMVISLSPLISRKLSKSLWFKKFMMSIQIMSREALMSGRCILTYA